MVRRIFFYRARRANKPAHATALVAHITKMPKNIAQLLLVAEIELPELEEKSVQNQENTKKIRFFTPMIFQWVSLTESPRE